MDKRVKPETMGRCLVRRRFLEGAMAAGSLWVTTPAWLAAAETPLKRARRLHDEANIVLSHSHNFELSDFNDMKTGGITAQVMKLTTDGIDWVDGVRVSVPELTGWTQRYLDHHADVMAIVDNPANNVMVIETVADFQTAESLGKSGVIFGSEGARHLEGNIANVEIFYNLGQREMQLFWPAGNQLFAGGHLTTFGEQVIAECNRLGILIGIEHVIQHGRAAFLEVIAASKDPVIQCHDVARTVGLGELPNGEVKAVAHSGGNRGVYAVHAISPNYHAKPPTVEDIVTSIDYIVKLLDNDGLVGIDHVALGPDWFPENGWGWIIDSPADIFDVTLALVNRGYGDEDIKKILGGNFLRFCKAVFEK